MNITIFIDDSKKPLTIPVDTTEKNAVLLHIISETGDEADVIIMKGSNYDVAKSQLIVSDSVAPYEVNLRTMKTKELVSGKEKSL